MALKLITAPTVEAVSINEAKGQCRIDIDDDDSLVVGKILTARTDVEILLRRALITQTWDWYMDKFPKEDHLDVPLPPLQSVTSIKYTDNLGVENTFASTSYIVDTMSEPGRIVLNTGYSWPGNTLRAANGVVIRFVCGYGAAAVNVPEPIRQAILLLVGHYYENREATAFKGDLDLVPKGVDALLGNYRIFDYAGEEPD